MTQLLVANCAVQQDLVMVTFCFHECVAQLAKACAQFCSLVVVNRAVSCITMSNSCFCSLLALSWSKLALCLLAFGFE